MLENVLNKPLFDLLDHSTNPHTDKFLDTMLTNFIQPCILEPTRVVNGNKPSLIDNIFTNAINKKIVSGNLLNKISDHMPSFIIASNILTPHNKEDRKIRDHKKMNVEQFKKDVDCINIEHYLQGAEDINQPYNLY